MKKIQFSDTLMLFVGRFFLSRVGEEYLAASMSGGKWKDIKMIDTEAPEYPCTVGTVPEIIAEEPVGSLLPED